jgi:superfamily I DNA and/or RNA helicase
MDESSKATAAEVLVPIGMAQNVVLLGDHKQLPPVITREEAVKTKIKKKLEDNGLDFDKEFGDSLFEQLILAFEGNPNLESNIKMLDVQYRMPKQIGSLISKYFYDGKLKNPSLEVIPNYDTNKSHFLNFKKDTSIVFVSTSKRDNPHDNDNKFNRSNAMNCTVIKETLTQLNTLYKDNLQREKPLTIGIIAGYRGQVNLLQKEINLSKYGNFIKKLDTLDSNGAPQTENLITINTVDKFQGAECDIIIYDVVKSSKGSSTIGFLEDYRRINVAFSRVKRLLIVVGDSEYLLKRATLNPQSKFTDFKLQQITADLDEQGLIVHNLQDIIQ